MRATAIAIFAFIVLIFGVALGPAFVGYLSDRFGAYLTVHACPTNGAMLVCDAADGLRPALIALSPLYLWAALHYVIAARKLPRAPSAANDAPGNAAANPSPS
jgi:MFS family permease